MQRCDGVKPTCQQCVRAKKPELCQYDDGKTKTKTQMLRENIERLEQRIRELEDPEYAPPAVALQYPQFHRRSESSSSSSTGSPDSSGFSAPHSPFSPSGMLFPLERIRSTRLTSYHLVTSSPQETWIHCHTSPPPTPANEACQMGQQPSVEYAQMLSVTLVPSSGLCS